MISISPTESEILGALRAFLVGVLPSGVDAILGQDNRVAEPAGTSFVEMWPILRPRLATNVDEPSDTAFTASIAGTTMTVTEVELGAILDNRVLFGTGVAAGTEVVSQLDGAPGGIGTYLVSLSQTVGSEVMATGEVLTTQETEVVVQLDVHAATLRAGGDMAATVATMFRDPYAARVIGESNANVSPLWCDDPRQTPFINAEQQYEARWTVDVHLQANQTVMGVPQQFAGAVSVDVISVDAAYPVS